MLTTDEETEAQRVDVTRLERGKTTPRAPLGHALLPHRGLRVAEHLRVTGRDTDPPNRRV